MKTLIVSVYDDPYNFSVYDNGIFYGKRDLRKESNKFFGMFDSSTYPEMYILDHFMDEYDLIVVCEDGDINVMKGPTE